jgi:hypothetical protein
MTSRKKLLQECGLPDVPETSHCFRDTTHLTCCMLGPEARKYADQSGNPIGKLAERVQQGRNHFNNVYPWCTCAGSQVCSFYKDKFKDGTYLKFFYNPVTQTVVRNPFYESTEFKKTGYRLHKTPGVL